MGTGKINRIILSALLLTVAWSCNNDHNDPVPVESIFKVIPESGLTTTRFEFDAALTMAAANEDHPVLVRYDWQNDGLWDRDYTTNSKIIHRYLKPGSYTIRMEARNMSGARDSSFATIVVEQGHSAPIAALSILPDSANIYTWFSLSAAKSYDDEDSANLLTFRWDFDGDGNWDTDYASDASILHVYPDIGRYQAGVEVKDPTNRSSVLRKLVTVDLLNDSILPQFTADGGFSTVLDIFKFDASGSKFLGREDKILTYSWDIHNDGLWEALNLTAPFFNQVIKTEGMVKIKLRVTDDRGLYMDAISKIEVFPENSPPKAVLVLGNRLGNVLTNYFFHSYGSSDRETSILDLKYQWDVNGDGLWDPEFDNLREITYRYSSTGKYLVKLKVTDAHDDSAIKSDTVFVYAGQHETGLLVDKRNPMPDYYAIAKIGKLWWMQENLFYKKEPTKDSPGLIPMCYSGDTTWWEQFGGLYHYIRICPKGWRLPTRAEFQEIVDLEAPNSIAPLLLGGSSELHILLGGYIDITKRSLGGGTVTNFWLSEVSPNGSPYVWYIDKTKGANKAVVASQTYGYSMRCVKSD